MARKKNKAIVKKTPQSQFPVPGDTMREQVLKAAGLDIKELGAIVREGVTTAVEQLTARQMVFAKYQGSLGESIDLPDNAVQLSAAKVLLELGGAFPTRFQDGGKGQAPTKIVVQLSWGPGKGQEAQIIEAKGTEVE